MARFEIHDQMGMMDLIQEIGFLPLLDSGIKGFSAEEMADDECRYVVFPDGGWDWPLWKWKGPIVTESPCVYGKFFAQKAGFVSRDWWPDLYNYRRSRMPVPEEGRKHVIDIQLLFQEFRAGAHRIGVSLGVTDAIDMGDEASVATKGMHIMTNLDARKRILRTSGYRLEMERDVLAIESDVGHILGRTNDIDIMVPHLLHLEGGESHLIDGLLHRGDPHHGRVAVGGAAVAMGVLVKIDSNGQIGFQIGARLIDQVHGKGGAFARIQVTEGLTVTGDGSTIEKGGHLDLIVTKVHVGRGVGAGDQEASAPKIGRHGLFKHMVVTGAQPTWDAREAIAIENRDGFVGHHPSAREIALVVVAAALVVVHHMIHLSLVQVDGIGLSRGMVVVGQDGGRDLHGGALLGGDH